MKLTPNQREVAAQILEAKSFSLSNQSSDDYVEAAAWVFDNGIFYLGKAGVEEVIIALRKPRREPQP